MSPTTLGSDACNDNLLLSHADRTRFISEKYFEQGFTADGPMLSILLLDGFTSAAWRITRRSGVATLTIQPFDQLSKQDAVAVTDEGARLLTFAAADAAVRDVRIMPPI